MCPHLHVQHKRTARAVEQQSNTPAPAPVSARRHCGRWVKEQASECPKELWTDGVEDYLNHAKKLLQAGPCWRACKPCQRVPISGCCACSLLCVPAPARTPLTWCPITASGRMQQYAMRLPCPAVLCVAELHPLLRSRTSRTCWAAAAARMGWQPSRQRWRRRR